MKNIIYSATPIDGVINIPLKNACICDIGLVSITFPYTGRNKVDQCYRDLEISCDQVDSTVLNSKRLLRRICTPYQFPNHETPDVYTTHEFETILFFPIDSTDKKLTIRISDQYGPLYLAKTTADRQNPQKVTICLQLRPQDGDRHWKKYI